jgi:Domain of unknown function (DUF4919)
VIKSRLQRAALLSIFSFLCFAQGPAASPYEAMVEKIKAGDTDINFRQLWLSYVAFQVRNTRKNTDPQKLAMNQALRDKDYKKALEQAESVLHEEFVSLDAHSAESIIYREEGQSEKADRQNWILEGLRHSMTNSADAKSPETAFEIKNVHEEYVVLRLAGLMPSKQSLTYINSHPYDILEAVDPNSNEQFKFYFDLSKGF